MPLVEVTVAGRRHSVQCGNGQEPRLRKLASFVDAKATEIAKGGPGVPESRLMLITSLMVADELFDAYEEVQRLKGDIDRKVGEADSAAAQAVERVTERLERLAAALEAP